MGRSYRRGGYGGGYGGRGRGTGCGFGIAIAIFILIPGFLSLFSDFVMDIFPYIIILMFFVLIVILIIWFIYALFHPNDWLPNDRIDS